ncbi:MAG: bifunctional diaminohydroxyphosphoribosylaminopyrimidine deaminase/5-amino-6-(5-phosphoribosylamino)uracil reductase RibD [Thermostichus sp. HHBFW_bins_43]
MLQAIAQARKGEGLTRPNPPVGAVLVKNGCLLAEGFHPKAGSPHAEIIVLTAVGGRAHGADLYVTLEPCSTWGRTPPCTDAIIRAGIRRVIAGTTDPNPKHAGRGFQLLREANVAVSVGVCEPECKALIEPFAMLQREGRPFVTLKLGMSLDGRIADRYGHSRWITGPSARSQVHALRRRVDGILIGRETAFQDNPSLLPDPADGRAPWRIVLDPHGRLPMQLKLFSDAHRQQTLVFVGPETPEQYRRELETRGVSCEVLPTQNGRFRMRCVLRALGARELLHVLCEGGGVLAAALLAENLVDEAWYFIAPKLLGGEGRPAVGGSGWPLVHAPNWRILDVQMIPPDVWIRARPQRDEVLDTGLPLTREHPG